MFPWCLWFSFQLYCFPLFLCIVHLGRLSYLSLLFIGMLHSDGHIFPFLLCLLLLFSSHIFVRAPQTTIWPFHISFSWWFWSPPPIPCYERLSIVLQALCLSDLIPWIYLSIPLYKGFKSYLNGTVVFPTFFNLSLNVTIRSSWSKSQSAPSLVFIDCIVTPSSAAMNIFNLISVLTIWWCPCVESSFVLLEEGVCYDQCVLLVKLC